MNISKHALYYMLQFIQDLKEILKCSVQDGGIFIESEG